MPPVRIQALILLIPMLTAGNTPAAEVFFTPSKVCEEKIVKSIDESKATVVVAVYSINNRKIMASLVSAQKRGVKVRILSDSLQAAGPSSGVIELVQKKLDVRIHSVSKIMHNKFAVFDGKAAVSGSFNWTEAASNNNSENCILFNEPNVLEAYSKRFDVLWEQNTKAKSDVKLAKLKTKINLRRPAGD